MFFFFDVFFIEIIEVEVEVDLENWVDVFLEVFLLDMDFGGGEENFEFMDLVMELFDINDEGIINLG